MNDKTLDSTNRTIYIILFCCFIFVGGLLFFFVDFDKYTSDVCSFHKDLFESRLDSAVVIRHFVDKPDHARKTVHLREKTNEYTIYFSPYDNWSDFDSLRLGDVIRKDRDTFEMKVNNDWTFRLRYDCTY
jgi:hypothetical protein